MLELKLGIFKLFSFNREGNGNPLQYSCLENSMGQRSLAGCSPWDLKELDTTVQLTFFLLSFLVSVYADFSSDLPAIQSSKLKVLI